MPRNMIPLEIKHIQLEVDSSELGMVELTDLASQVENFMKEAQAAGEIDTLKQALRAALHFAAQAYLNHQNEGGKRKEEESRLDSLISKLKNTLENK